MVVRISAISGVHMNRVIVFELPADIPFSLHGFGTFQESSRASYQTEASKIFLILSPCNNEKYRPSTLIGIWSPKSEFYNVL